MIKVKNYADKAEIYIYGVIIDDTDAKWIFNEDGEILGYVYPERIRKELDDIGAKPVEVHIASDGGDVAAGIALFNMLKDKEVTVFVDSWAASIASVIAFSGKKIIMPENTFLMVHNPQGGGFGEAEYLRSIAEWLEKIRNMIANTYAAKLKVGENEDEKRKICLEYMDKETWFTAKEAAELFDNVELVESNNIEAVASLKSLYKSAPKNLTDNVVKNKIIKVLMEAYAK